MLLQNYIDTLTGKYINDRNMPYNWLVKINFCNLYTVLCKSFMQVRKFFPFGNFHFAILDFSLL